MTTRQVYRGNVVNVRRDSVVLPNGHRAELEVVEHPGGAAVLALDDNDRVCLLKQYRHVVGDFIWELPAGKREADEPPEQTARRELAEEAGVKAAHWSPLGKMYSSPGVFDEAVYLFLARDLTATSTQREPSENLEVHWVPLAEAARMARDGRIDDAKTVIALLRALALE